VTTARSIADNLSEIESRIRNAAERAGRRREEIRLVAATKDQPPPAIREALAAGVREVGENYVQEAAAKWASLPEPAPVRHLIGRLQRNKAGKAVLLFDVVQTVDAIDVARALSRRAEALGTPVEVLIEVNATGEPQKGGVAPGGALDLVEEVASLPALRVTGLMGMGPLEGSSLEVRGCFAALARLFGRLAPAHRRVLSMGMTGDFETAIEEGSTMVRIGTGIFGARRSSG